MSAKLSDFSFCSCFFNDTIIGKIITYIMYGMKEKICNKRHLEIRLVHYILEENNYSLENYIYYKDD